VFLEGSEKVQKTKRARPERERERECTANIKEHKKRREKT